MICQFIPSLWAGSVALKGQGGMFLVSRDDLWLKKAMA
jgi:hypothetical protein